MAGFRLYDLTNSVEHELSEGKTVVGRSAESDMRVLSSSVSRKHGEFELDGDVLTYTDLGSSNGSFLNGKPVEGRVELDNGDSLLLGDFRFQVIAERPAAASGEVDDDVTQLSASSNDDPIPAMWSEQAGLEKASNTQFFSDSGGSDAAQAYNTGAIQVPPIAEAPRLVGLTGEISGRVFPLGGYQPAGSGTWKIGRDESSVDIVIPESSVSGQHAQLVQDKARWKVVNWMSTNGTFVNGQKGLSTYLSSGDIIRMGSAELAFELPASAQQASEEGEKVPPTDTGESWLDRLWEGRLESFWKHRLEPFWKNRLEPLWKRWFGRR